MKFVHNADCLECPTAISAIMLRLYVAENDVDLIDYEPLIAWWVNKIVTPDSRDHWLDGRLWRLFARHLHALVAVNASLAEDWAAYHLGIKSPLVRIPHIEIDKSSAVLESWITVDYTSAPAPYGFDVWDEPLQLSKNAVMMDEDGEILPEFVDA